MRLNLLLARWSGHPRLTDHADSGWHLHYRADGLPAGAVIAAVGAVGTALHLTSWCTIGLDQPGGSSRSV
jgi:hypothetical protein